MDPSRPYNELPPLPPNTTVDTARVLRAAIDANRELGRLSGYCSQLPIMLESRLQKRLRALNFDTFDAYIEHVFNQDSSEIIHMIDVVTTNKTDFFIVTSSATAPRSIRLTATLPKNS